MMKRHIICIQTMEIIIIQIEAQEEHSFHVEVFWAVTPCSVAVGGPCCLHLQGDLRNVGILPRLRTASQPRRPRLETPLL
jgi:hypothetical protein